MTLNLFIILLVALCAISTLLTEAIKQFLINKGENPSANLIALIDAVVVGAGGTIVAYIFMNISFTLSNIFAIICMTIAIWIGSMIGYDKVIQLLEQLKTK